MALGVSRRSQAAAILEERPQPTYTRSLAIVASFAGPLGVLGWIILQQMPNVHWWVAQVLQHLGGQ
jgi:hypothetical protein